MYNITISSSATFIYRDSDNNNKDSSNLMGFLLHQEGIKEMIEALPISKYYVQITQGNSEEISKEQAFMLYDLILEYHKNNKEEIAKKTKEKYKKLYNHSEKKLK